jgi:hypothetical protein
MIQPVATTDYLMNTKKDGTGTDITTDLTVSVVYHTASADVTLTNASAYTGKITKLELRGYGVYQDSEVKAKAEDTASITDYGMMELNVEQQYQRDTTPGAVMANRILQTEKDPRTKLDRVQIVANTSHTHMAAFLSMDVGDMVKITESNLGLSNYYYVQGIEFEIISNSVIIYSWILTDVEPSVASGALTSATMEFEILTDKAIDYGVIPAIENALERTIILSVYVSSTTGVPFSYGADSNTTGLQTQNTIYIFNESAKYYLGFRNSGFTTQAGLWYSDKDATPITASTWARIAITVEPNKTNSFPLFYVDGALVAPEPDIDGSVHQLPIGSRIGEENTCLYLGGVYSVDTDDYLCKFTGQIKNPLVYNRILSADEIALDAATPGCITEDLEFAGIYIPTSKTTEYYDAALTELQKVFDNINGLIGTPKDAPVCREIT